MSKLNKYSGVCQCGTEVPAGAGFLHMLAGATHTKAAIMKYHAQAAGRHVRKFGSGAVAWYVLCSQCEALRINK